MIAVVIPTTCSKVPIGSRSETSTETTKSQQDHDRADEQERSQGPAIRPELQHRFVRHHRGRPFTVMPR
ncbi:hypothetical protein [Fodinicola feengrottensis]|uniref:hypothetical protein n=1 Tax=Fodinicola feengrottensis TaxID=435914 RepID=UPI0013D78271